MADPNDSRAALTSRVLPQMAFSDGSFASMTGPPPPMPHYLNSEGRAMKRFAIEGNAVCMLSLQLRAVYAPSCVRDFVLGKKKGHGAVDNRTLMLRCVYRRPLARTVICTDRAMRYQLSKIS